MEHKSNVLGLTRCEITGARINPGLGKAEVYTNLQGVSSLRKKIKIANTELETKVRFI